MGVIKDLADLLIKLQEVRGDRKEKDFKELVQPTYQACREIRDDLHSLYRSHEEAVKDAIASARICYSADQVASLFDDLIKSIDEAREQTRADRDLLRARTEVRYADGEPRPFDVDVAEFVWYSGGHELQRFVYELKAQQRFLTRRADEVDRRHLQATITKELKEHLERTVDARKKLLENWSSLTEKYAALLEDHGGK
ncbi:MAG: hypothetical protein AAF662_09565 [Pseudomonadota bacterium]